MRCDYCKGIKDQLDLKNKNGTVIYIDADEHKICFEHTEVRGNIEAPWDYKEDFLYQEIDIEYCPICGGRFE